MLLMRLNFFLDALGKNAGLITIFVETLTILLLQKEIIAFQNLKPFEK